MKIISLELLRVPPSWVWLKVHTDEGIVGLGEPYLENHAESVIAEVTRLTPLLLGQDPLRIEDLWRQLYNAGLGYKGGPVTMSAISGIDMALWDIAGKAAGLPVHRLLGGRCRDSIQVYRASSGAPPHCVEPGLPYRAGGVAGSDDPAAWAACAAELVGKWGFRCLKLHFEPGEDLQAVTKLPGIAAQFAAAREAVGDDVQLAVDIHNPHPAIAAQLFELLAPYHPLFVEEPMPIERVDVLRQIASRTSLPIAAGERWMGKWVFFDALRDGSLAVVQPDLCHAGGITECKKIAAITEAAYASVALHCPLSPLAFAASVQLDACLPNFLVQEHNEVNDWHENGRTVIGRGYLAEPFTLDADGCVAVPDRPGLGIDLDEEGMRMVMQQPWSTVRG